MRLDPASNVLRPVLTTKEIVGLILTVEYLRATNMVPFAGFAKSALRKIENTLPKGRVKELRGFMGRILIGTREMQYGAPGEIQLSTAELVVIEEAFSHRLNVRICYQDASGNKTIRTIEPQALLVLFPAWYVLGYDPAKEGLRMFRADRIKWIKMLDGQSFELKPLADVRSGCPDGVL